MLAAALVDFGRRLRCGDDGSDARVPANLHGRNVRILGIRVLSNLSSQRCRRGARRTTFEHHEHEQGHAVGGDGHCSRLLVLPTSLHRFRYCRRPVHGRHGPNGDQHRRHDVTHVSAESRKGPRISTGRAGSQSRFFKETSHHRHKSRQPYSNRRNTRRLEVDRIPRRIRRTSSRQMTSSCRAAQRQSPVVPIRSD